MLRPCNAPIEAIIIIAHQKMSEKVGYECDSIGMNTGTSASDLPNVYEENTERDKSNVFFVRGGVGEEIQLFISMKPTVLGGRGRRICSNKNSSEISNERKLFKDEIQRKIFRVLS